MQQLIVAGIAALVGVIYVFMTGRIFISPLSDPSGPRAYPYLLAALLLIGCGVLIGEGLAARKAAGRNAAKADTGDGIQLWPLIPVVLWTGAYFLTFEPLGYMISTTIYLIALMWIFNPGKHVANVTTSVAFSVLTYLILVKLLEAQLPAGLLGRIGV
jgi:putative tricarboxylic transport membrane protein